MSQTNVLEIKKDLKLCSLEGCIEKRHGVFLECKKHFHERHRKGNKYKWTPSDIGYKTLISILSCYPLIIDSSEIQETHLNNGADSRPPVRCVLCDNKWSPR